MISVSIPRLLRTGFALCALLVLSIVASRAIAADDFLDPEVAFKASARASDPRTVEVSFEIAPGYYLYREQFKFEASGATLGTPDIPAGHVKFDENFQKNVETYRDVLRIAVPVQQAGADFRLAVTYQGCADKGLCYPPAQMRVDVSPAGFGGTGTVRVLPGRDTPPPAGAAATSASAIDSTGIDAVLRSGRFWSVIGIFFAAGMLLSLTPCVLPMLPILSSIIVGQGGSTSRGRGLLLAASYSLGMALIYTGLGIGAGLAGEGLAATLQKPWVLGVFAALLVGFSLSMFGVYELQLPSRWTGPLTQASQRLPAGRLAGVFVMGGVSALIVSPCVAAPLAGALVYLSQTRDVALGGSALFALACGMSVPLLLLGASAGALLPRAGAWMDDVKRFFGMLLLGVALWTVQSVLPGSIALALWGILLVACAVMLFALQPKSGRGSAGRLLRRGAGTLVGVFGLLQLVGAASGGSDPLQPLVHLKGMGSSVPASRVSFTTIRSAGDLDVALRGAGRPVMLDFYADWCVSCKEMDRFTFSDPAVAARLTGALLLRADVTRNNADDRELLKRFMLFGPPGTIFFDGQGREVPGTRVIGYQNTARFIETLQQAGL